MKRSISVNNREPERFPMQKQKIWRWQSWILALGWLVLWLVGWTCNKVVQPLPGRTETVADPVMEGDVVSGILCLLLVVQ